MKRRIALCGLFVLSLFFICSMGVDQLMAQEKAQETKEPPAYVIGPTDKLQIFVWKEEDLTRDVTVMADGRITFPLIGEIMAAGKTIASLREDITRKLEKFVTTPEVTVMLVADLSRRIYTIGKLSGPGPLALAPDMTILQAISTAGGFAEWADTKNVLIVRREKGKETRLQFNYKEFISGKNVKQNILLKPNDTIVVP